MTLPRVQPIPPTWHKEPFDDPDWLFDFKYDGFRAICYLEHRRNRLISRNNNVMTRFEALAGQVAAALNIDEASVRPQVGRYDATPSAAQQSASIA
jgi:ATP-dependent DNA ligase